MSAHIRALAARLGELDETQLIALLASRAAPPNARWSDAFDAAEWLLDAPAIAQALAQLERPQLEALAHAAASADPIAARHPARDVLDALALIDEQGAPYGPVAAEVLTWSGADEPRDPLEHDTHSVNEAAAAAAERAFTSVAALGDILVETMALPLTRIGSGTVGAHDRRRLAEDAVPLADDIDALITLGVTAELLTLVDRHWLVTERGSRWLRQPTLDRWVVVARAWRAALPAGIQNEPDARTWHAAYPADASWPARAATLRSEAEAWGLVTAEGPEAEWAALLRGDDTAGADAPGPALSETAAAAALGTLLPSEVTNVYLQNDLTAIAPGPLAPALDLRLRTMARRESHAQASTYRFTAETIAAAVTDGESAASILAFLEGLSLTGIPQPLDYLIASAAGRHGMIRVRSIENLARSGSHTAQTLITTDEPALLDTMLVDQSLQALALTRSDSENESAGIESRASRDVVYWSLIDARYPAAALDSAGVAEPLHRHRIAANPAPVPPATDVYGALAATLHSGPASEGDAAWLARDLEVAARGRETVTLVVALPGGESREFTVELTGIGGGRVRGRDKGADLERTLPLSSITAVRRS